MMLSLFLHPSNPFRQTILTQYYSNRRAKRASDFLYTILIFYYSYIYIVTILRVLLFLLSYLPESPTILT